MADRDLLHGSSTVSPGSSGPTSSGGLSTTWTGSAWGGGG